MPAPEEREPASNPDALAKALEIELTLKRASWQQARARRGTWRTLSILFLLLVLGGAFLVYFFVLPQLSQRGGKAVEPEAVEPAR
ncbi:MAG: hypothetical protein ABI787_05650 [Spartobacteria bacterium]